MKHEPARKWTATPAVRHHVPLLVGIMGPSGGGKTYSALRLGRGIQHVVGGALYGIDTEHDRMLHYADEFDFTHVPFRPPFSSDAYLDVMRWSVAQGAKTIIVDSMSHEHSGDGGYLDFHDKELDRLCQNPDDQRERDRRNMQAWIKPAAARQKLIQGMLQLDANFIFTFRAKEKVKPTGGGKVEEMGFMPIAGEEFLFEMTVCCLLMPVAGGVPTWASAMPGERMMIKPARQFADLFNSYGAGGTPLSEKHGEGLALWARGKPTEAATAPSAPTGPTPPDTSAPAPAPHEVATAGASGLDPSWDALAWAKNFQDMIAEVHSTADLDALREDPSNVECFAALVERHKDRAKSLSAAITGRRKALADREAPAL